MTDIKKNGLGADKSELSLTDKLKLFEKEIVDHVSLKPKAAHKFSYLKEHEIEKIRKEEANKMSSTSQDELMKALQETVGSAEYTHMITSVTKRDPYIPKEMLSSYPVKVMRSQSLTPERCRNFSNGNSNHAMSESGYYTVDRCHSLRLERKQRNKMKRRSMDIGDDEDRYSLPDMDRVIHAERRTDKVTRTNMVKNTQIHRQQSLDDNIQTKSLMAKFYLLQDADIDENISRNGDLCNRVNSTNQQLKNLMLDDEEA